MIENFRKQVILLAAAALVAGCNVSASGQVPCVDDSSCPSDYPVCKAGFCVEATAGAATASISIIGVPGKASNEPVKGTVTVQVSAKADSGVKSVSLSGGGKTFSPAAGATGPVFDIPVDTTTLTDGQVALTATVTPGDAAATAVTSSAYNLVVDNTAPTFSGATLASADLKAGDSVALDITASEALASISGSVSQSGVSVPLADTNPSGTTHHLIATLPSTAAAGTWTISVSATDLAGNAATFGSAPSVTVHAPFTLAAANLTLSTGAITTGNDLGISVSIPSGVTLASGAKPVVTVAPSGGTTSALTVSGSGPFTATFHEGGSDADGSYEISVTVTDIAGNTATFAKGFIVDKTGPAIPGGIALATPIAGPNLPVSFSFAVSEVPASFTATVNGHAASCGAASTNISCTYTPTTSDVAAGTTASKTISVTVKDALNNSTNSTTSVSLDNQAPTLTVTNDLTGGVNATGGTLLTLDVTASETLSASSATVVSGSTCGGTATGTSFSDVAAPTGNTRHLGFAVTGATAAGDYTLCLNGTDLANNVATQVSRTFHVFSGFSFGANALTLSAPGNTTDAQGFALVSGVSGHKTLSGVIALPIGGSQLGSNVPVVTFNSKTVSGVSCPGASCTFTYNVDTGGADAQGLYVMTATLTDQAGTTASTTASFEIDKTAPAVSGIAITPNIAGINQGFLVTFATSEALSTSQVVVKANGSNTVLSCAGSTSWSCGGTDSTHVYTPSVTDNGTVSVTVTDTVGNATALSPGYTLDNTAPALGSPTLSATSGVVPGSW